MRFRHQAVHDMELRWPLTLMIQCHLAASSRHHSQRAALRLVSRVERYEQVLVGSNPTVGGRIGSSSFLGKRRPVLLRIFLLELEYPFQCRSNESFSSASVTVNHRSTDGQHQQSWVKWVMTLWSLCRDLILISFLLKRGVGPLG
jgi:hypothetical protein